MLPAALVDSQCDSEYDWMLRRDGSNPFIRSPRRFLENRPSPVGRSMRKAIPALEKMILRPPKGRDPALPQPLDWWLCARSFDPFLIAPGRFPPAPGS